MSDVWFYEPVTEEGNRAVYTFGTWIFTSRVKSGNFGHQVNSDSDLVCFIFYFLE